MIVCHYIMSHKQKSGAFINRWKNSTPAKKLTYYGMVKLNILADMKKTPINKRTDKKTLINALKKVITQKDLNTLKKKKLIVSVPDHFSLI